MQESQAEPTADQPAKVWQKTQFTNLIRYLPSGTYYARLRVAGKLIRESLKTDVLSVAKLRLADLDKQERQRAESTDAVARGKMTVGDAIEIHKERVAGDASLKPRAKECDGQRIVALLKSWPGLKEKLFRFELGRELWCLRQCPCHQLTTQKWLVL